jgi:hypothetical protein
VSGAGRRYEHELSGELDTATTDDVWTTTAGFSGNAAIDACDIVVTVNPAYTLSGGTIQYNIEAKKRQADAGKRCSSVFAGSADGETGVGELRRFIEATPDWGQPVLVVSFTRRRPITIDARILATHLAETAETDVKTLSGVPYMCGGPATERLLDATAPRVTPSGNVSLVKPETDVLDSASASPSEGQCVAEDLRLPCVE